MIKKRTPLNKIYIGLTLFFINLFCFFATTELDKKNKTNFFIFFVLFLALIIVFVTTKEILNLNKTSKNIFLQFIFLIYSLFYFFYFCLFLLKNISNKLSEDNLIKKIIINFKTEHILFGVLFFLLILWLFYLFIHEFHIQNLFSILFALIYVVFCSSCFFVLNCFHYRWFCYLFVITISNDSFSFLGGYYFGKRLLFPSVSPKKTWEGSIIGIIFTFFICFIFFHDVISIGFFIFTFFNCIISQMGDLIASKLKRDFSIKDFSGFIPGHGGLLDRFDSLLFLSFFIIVLFLFPNDNISDFLHSLFLNK
ncbi:phosphatidate cytidylyltransferase [Candidatus Phytoplasma luffae]|uniref:Phosphatidate cytidylyltransferase n=1 Tax=Loofah witches'-broom phytoplasma TaxID=35773 RepID=A0A975FJW7_LOWBP|nr:phosphatidate cytidylyltransferase [Candidatus Phytoplasma luffae]QTX03137.1 phosphatidate cytidylyltransferase [Candidatus Phytoplasma luffae]